MTQTKLRHGSQTLSANCQLRVASSPGKTGATSSLNRSRINRRSQEAGIGLLQDTACSTGSEAGSLAGRGSERRLVREFAGGLTGEPLDVRPSPVWARPRSSAHTRTTATISEPVVRGRVSASSQTPHYLMGGVALRKVPFPLLNFAVGQFRVHCREHAGHRVPVRVGGCSRYGLSGSHSNTYA